MHLYEREMAGSGRSRKKDLRSKRVGSEQAHQGRIVNHILKTGYLLTYQVALSLPFMAVSTISTS